MTSHDFIYDVFWSKWSNFDGSTPNLMQWSIESHMGHKSKLCSDRGHNVDVMAVLWPFYGSIMSKWEFLRYEAIIS